MSTIIITRQPQTISWCFNQQYNENSCTDWHVDFTRNLWFRWQ